MPSVAVVYYIVDGPGVARPRDRFSPKIRELITMRYFLLRRPCRLSRVSAGHFASNSQEGCDANTYCNRQSGGSIINKRLYVVIEQDVERKLIVITFMLIHGICIDLWIDTLAAVT